MDEKMLNADRRLGWIGLCMGFVLIFVGMVDESIGLMLVGLVLGLVSNEFLEIKRRG